MGGPQRILEMVGALRSTLCALEPGVYSAADCARLAEALAQTEKACGAARVLLAKRAAELGVHKDRGFSDAAAWLAQMAGSTARQAKDALATAASLEACPATKDALVAGQVSMSQAQEIARAAAEMPGSEHDLLEIARHGDLTKVRDETRERRLSSTPVDQLHRRQLAARRFRHWRDGLGMVCFEGALPPASGLPIVARIEREAARRHREAKRTGVPERFEAYAADAFVALSSREGAEKRGPNVDLVVVCDLYAWRRGHTHDGEPCQLIGGGPIPVDVAKRLSKDAFLKVVLHDGKDILKVRHEGRRYTAELRTALDLGPVPAFSGRACVDCKQTWRLERDHDDPVAHNGPTTYKNLKDRCYACHAEKTERDRRAGLLGPKAKARGPGPPDRKTRAGRTGAPRAAAGRTPPRSAPAAASP